MLNCVDPHSNSKQWQAVTTIVDCIMLAIASCCLILTLYGIYRYVTVYKRLDSTFRTPKRLYISGLIFLITSSFTLLNALIYDVLFLVCPGVDDYEAIFYHISYFAQIYTLWIVLFLRIYFVFKNSALGLSKCVIQAYICAFISVALIIIPLYAIYDLEADSYITLPYITLSTIFCASLLLTFVYKLFEIFSKLGVDRGLLNTMTKHTLLAVISISWTLLVVLVLLILFIYHDGDYYADSVIEELILEVFILLDIVSNFVCVLLTYSFFDKQYHSLCGALHRKCFDYLSKQVIVAIHHMSATVSKENKGVTLSIQSIDGVTTSYRNNKDGMRKEYTESFGTVMLSKSPSSLNYSMPELMCSPVSVSKSPVIPVVPVEPVLKGSQSLP